MTARPCKPHRTRLRNARLHSIAPAFVVVATLMLCGRSTFSRANTLEVGLGKPFALPSQAAAIAKDGDHIEIAAGTYADCAVWRANDLVIEGIEPGVIISDKTCMGNGLFVIIGNDVTVK